MNRITITFKNQKFRRFPKVKIYIDHNLVEMVHFDKEEQSVHIPIALEDGKHVLEIEHFDKTSRDTHFEDGKRIADTEFTIKSIVLDDFKFFYYLLCLCEFRAVWNGMVKPKDFPDVIRQGLTVGPNGKWKLPFETPIDDWLIQRRINETTQNHNLPTK